jgi:hypothetical protein
MDVFTFPKCVLDVVLRPINEGLHQTRPKIEGDVAEADIEADVAAGVQRLRRVVAVVGFFRRHQRRLLELRAQA